MKSLFKYISISALFLVPVFSLIVTNSLFFPFITGKGFYFRILIEIAFASWLILALLEPKYRPKWNSMTVGITIFALVGLVADLFGMNPLRSIWSNFERMEGWVIIAHLWAFYMAIVHLFGKEAEGEKMWKRWINTSLFIAFIVAIYGLVQLLGWADIHQGSTRIDASLGNAAYMAVYMLFHCFLALYLFSREFRAGHNIVSATYKWIYAILALLFAFEVYETGTRGTIIGLVLGILLSALIYSVFGKGEKKGSRIAAAVFIALVIVAGVTFWLNKDSAFVQKYEVLRRLASISLNETQTQARAYIWPMAIEGFTQRPILGWGQENFNYIFNANYNPHMYNQEQWFDRAHSVFLDWLVAGGVVGFLSYLSLFILGIYLVWKSTLSIKEKSLLTGLFVAYAIHNVFVFDNIASYILFFAVLGLSQVHVGQIKNKKKIYREINTEAVEYVAMPIALILFVIILYFVNIKPLTANIRLIDAVANCSSNNPLASKYERAYEVNSYLANQEIREQYSSCVPRIIRGQYSNEVKDTALNLFNQFVSDQISASPKDARVYVLAGTSLNTMNGWRQSIPLFEKAMLLSPSKQYIKINLATAYINNDMIDKGISLLKSAYESATEMNEVKRTYITGLIYAGREGEARNMFPNDKDLFMDENIANYYVVHKAYDKAVAVYKYLVDKDSKNVNLLFRLAQVYNTGGMKYEATQILKKAEEMSPEYKTQIEDAIKEINKNI